MAYLDENGTIHSVSNSTPELLKRTLTDPIGIIATIIPIIILAIIFYFIKKKTDNKKTLITYSIVSTLLYLVYFKILLSMFILV